MYTRIVKVYLAIGICSFLSLFADEGSTDDLQETLPILSPLEMSEAPRSSISEPVVLTPSSTVKKPFNPFTGKIKGKKVRMRVGADLESRVVKELVRNDLLIILGEKGDFYAVEPPEGTKAYVFRSFILDGIVEGNRVNVRLEPSIEAPVIGHLSSGEKIQGEISVTHNKWYEIPPPADTRFYIAKEFIEQIGGPEFKSKIEKRKSTAVHALETAQIYTKSELQKPFNEIAFGPIKQRFESFITEYTDFPELVAEAKTSLANLQDDYLQKKIAFLEEGVSAVSKSSSSQESSRPAEIVLNPHERMKLWQIEEEKAYSEWASSHQSDSIEELYKEQKQMSTTLTGTLETYFAPIKRKPGDFILKNDKNVPIGYLYSTQVNLYELVGKRVSVVVSPRPNNNFAFPAYFVHEVE